MQNRSFYNEILTEHNIRPEFKHDLENPDIVVEGVNPSCGDDVWLKLKLDGDTIVDGAYQWMYYYDSKFETSTSASTITSLMVQNEVDDEADEADWEAEYLELTNEDSFPYLNQYELQNFYSRVAKVRSTFKTSLPLFTLNLFINVVIDTYLVFISSLGLFNFLETFSKFC